MTGGSRTTAEVGVAPALPARLHELGVVEVVSGRDAVRDLWRTLLGGAREEVRVLDQPPHLSPQEEHAELEDSPRHRDVRWRVVHDRSAVDLPGRVTEIIELVSPGGSYPAAAGVQAMRRGWL